MKKLLKDPNYWKGFTIGAFLVAVVLTVVGLWFGAI